jgi:glycosyltransferase involved in cell wall biosynthesis
VKIVIVVPYFSPRTGGVETYALNLATGLERLGWQVVIVTTTSGKAEEHDTVAGMKVYRLPAALKFSNTPVGLRWRRRLRQIFAAERPDVINGHTPVPYLPDLAQRASKPVPYVLTYHNDLYKDAVIARAIVWGLNHTLIRRTLRRSTAIIATSEFYVRGSRYLQNFESKILIVPPGVNFAEFNSEVTVTSPLNSLFAGRRVVLFVGSLNKSQRHKGLDVLIEAFARVQASRPDVWLAVVGGGDWQGAYEAMAVAAGVAGRVRFAGRVTDAELAQYYKLATVFAMPSTDRSEGFGMVYAEAGAVGVPVIGANVGGVPYAVRHGETGLLVAPGSVGELEQALGRLLDDPDLASAMGAAGAARARAEFDWQPLTQRTSDLFKSLRSDEVDYEVIRGK